MNPDFSASNAREGHVPVFSLRGVFAPQISIPLFVIVLQALFAPADVLSRYEWCRAVTQFVVMVIPQVARHADSTAYPQVALLVSSLVWIFWPWCSVMYGLWCVLNWERAKTRLAKSGRYTWRQHITLLLGVPFCIGVLWFITAMPADPVAFDGLTTGNRIGLAFMNTLSLWLASVAVGFHAGNVLIFCRQLSK